LTPEGLVFKDEGISRSENIKQLLVAPSLISWNAAAELLDDIG
jgi:hypothetical protein